MERAEYRSVYTERGGAWSGGLEDVRDDSGHLKSVWRVHSVVMPLADPMCLLNCPKCYLDEGVYQRSQLTLLSLCSLGLGIAGSCEYHGPEVDGMHELPVIYLSVCFL